MSVVDGKKDRVRPPVDELERTMRSDTDRPDLVRCLEQFDLDGLDLDREADRGRDVAY